MSLLLGPALMTLPDVSSAGTLFHRDLKGGDRHRATAFSVAHLTSAALMLVLVGAAGCAPSNLADVIAAAAKDDATFCGRVTTVYGTATFMRSNVHGGDVSCDTLSVRSTTNISVPLTLTPRFSISNGMGQSAPLSLDPFGPGTPPVVPQAAPMSRAERRLQAEPPKP